MYELTKEYPEVSDPDPNEFAPINYILTKVQGDPCKTQLYISSILKTLK